MWLNRNGASPRAVRLIAVLAVVCCCALSVTLCEAGGNLYPAPLLNWMPAGAIHALIVEKSTQTISVWKTENGEPRKVETLPCSTGEVPGDKWVRGDMRTPEGVYFFCSLIDGERLPSKYGLWAFTTDYPNFIDRRHGKNGDGIWLHGRDKALADKPDSNGCIAMENEDLIRVSRYVRLQSTPLIVVNKLKMVPRSKLIAQETNAREFVESWRKAWESQNLDRYMSHYSKNFQSCWYDYRAWRKKKQKLINLYSRIRVRLGKVYLYRHNGVLTAIFTQDYQSDSYRAVGIKILYLVEEEEGYKVYGEDYRHLTDDAYPVRVLLARVGGDPMENGEETGFKIRLVSTDEPHASSDDRVEEPKPIAPARGVELAKLTPDDRRQPVIIPPLQKNIRREPAETRSRYLTAKLVPGTMPAFGLLPRRALTAKRIKLENAVESPSPAPAAKKKTVVLKKAAERDANSGEHDEQWRRTAASSASRRTHSVPAPARGLEKKMSIIASLSQEDRGEVLDFLKEWKEAWENKDLDRFVKMYHPHFRAGKMDLEEFRRSKERYFKKYDTIRVELDKLSVRKEGGTVRVLFQQIFRGDDYSDKGWKSVVLAEDKDKGFQILAEKWSPL